MFILFTTNKKHQVRKITTNKKSGTEDRRNHIISLNPVKEQ
jgi:hypothetical protein